MGTPYAYQVVEALDHRKLVAEANTLGAEGWQMCGMDQAHGFWIAVFMRQADGAPVEHVRSCIGDGVLELAGGLNVPAG